MTWYPTSKDEIQLARSMRRTKTDSKSGGVKNSTAAAAAAMVRWHLEEGGRRFLGAGGQDNCVGIRLSSPVGVVEQASSLYSSSTTSTSSPSAVSCFPGRRRLAEEVVVMDLREGVEETLGKIPAMTHFLPSKSKATAST